LGARAAGVRIPLDTWHAEAENTSMSTKIKPATRTLTCPRPTCKYTWTTRKAYPKACPLCKGYLRLWNAQDVVR
jgi:hypothetical protein